MGRGRTPSASVMAKREASVAERTAALENQQRVTAVADVAIQRTIDRQMGLTTGAPSLSTGFVDPARKVYNVSVKIGTQTITVANVTKNPDGSATVTFKRGNGETATKTYTGEGAFLKAKEFAEARGRDERDSLSRN